MGRVCGEWGRKGWVLKGRGQEGEWAECAGGGDRRAGC